MNKSHILTALQAGHGGGEAPGEEVGDITLTAAAVLIPIVLHPDGANVLLTQRTAHLTHHAGQISFPGGRVEDGDEDLISTALRESHEEVGLVPARVEVLGLLPEYRTVTGFAITPVVGVTAAPLELTLDSFEVAEAFEVPLGFLLDLGNYQRHQIMYQGRPREYFAVPYRDHFIWGATAGILHSFARLRWPERE